MKILMIGRGVISTLYGWALERAGHEVDFLVRPGRAAQFGPSVDLDIRDGRSVRGGRPVRQRWSVTLREDLPAGHDYDLVVLSVNPDQLEGAVADIGDRLGAATLLVFSNVWDEPTEVVAGVPRDQVVWGFPGGGGGYFGDTLRGGMVKAVTLGLIDSAEPTARHRAVRTLFEGAGFSVTEVADFRSWLWFHFILDAGLMAGIRTAGGFDAYVRSATASQLTVELIDEMTAVLEAKGGVRRVGAKAFRTLPTGVVAFGLRRLLGGDNLYGHLMRLVLASAHGNPEMTAMYPRRVLAEARRLGVDVPRLEALEPVFA